MNVCSMWRAVALMPTALILRAPILASVTAVLLAMGLVVEKVCYLYVDKINLVLPDYNTYDDILCKSCNHHKLPRISAPSPPPPPTYSPSDLQTKKIHRIISPLLACIKINSIVNDVFQPLSTGLQPAALSVDCVGCGGVLPSSRLMGVCRWMGLHFHDWNGYYGVAFL